MLNQVVLVGRLTTDPEIIKSENGKSRTQITLAIPRSYKNVNGEYESDFIRCVLWNGVAENTCEYCKKGDIVGVKGRMQSSSYEKDDETVYITEVIAERVTFLSSRKDNVESVSTEADE